MSDWRHKQYAADMLARAIDDMMSAAYCEPDGIEYIVGALDRALSPDNFRHLQYELRRADAPPDPVEEKWVAARRWEGEVMMESENQIPLEEARINLTAKKNWAAARGITVERLERELRGELIDDEREREDERARATDSIMHEAQRERVERVAKRHGISRYELERQAEWRGIPMEQLLMKAELPGRFELLHFDPREERPAKKPGKKSVKKPAQTKR
jgi:hypothetical protein